MPYIKPEDRVRVWGNKNPENVGELNFLITTYCLDCLKQEGESYKTHNHIMGVLKKAEVILLYEDDVDENADPLLVKILEACSNYILHNYKIIDLMNEQVDFDVFGVLECARLEWYRKRVAPYEDKKIIENGDV